MKKFLSCAALLAVLFYSCTKSGTDGDNNNPPDPPGGGGNCDTVNMEYAANVVPILQANCYSCHGTNTNSGSMGRVLEGYSNIKPYAESGTLVGVISHAQGFIPMPQNGPKLSQCNIDKIKSWIANGIKDN
ncbi:MAG: hypothetical protein EOO01_03350 [Chitinophagaceae bacterium]|nr:MAG: hypothetical protein EOO01_03350 [Chitinophagaceae bacterium]